VSSPASDFLSHPGIETAASSLLNCGLPLKEDQQDMRRTGTTHVVDRHFKATVLPMGVNVYIVKTKRLSSGQKVAHPKIGTVSGGMSMKFHIERMAGR
jgi:hypothetical protein